MLLAIREPLRQIALAIDVAPLCNGGRRQVRVRARRVLLQSVRQRNVEAVMQVGLARGVAEHEAGGAELLSQLEEMRKQAGGAPVDGDGDAGAETE